jgi:hypothetical protein
MKIEVSIGEAIDKYSILELKMKKITDKNKQLEILKEIDVLSECLIYKKQFLFYYNILVYVNEKIWDMTDIIKTITPDNPEFSHWSHQIFEFNQKRFRIKKWFNLMTNSNIKEQKSYASNHCKIVINKEQDIYDNIAKINYLSLDYDAITFESPFVSTIQKLFKLPIYNIDLLHNLPPPKIINIDEVNISENTDISIFEFSPITYISGGMFGDFIQSLSVINEQFYETGKKGILYISERGDVFRNGLKNTYNDTYGLMINQKYIKAYKIHNNESYDIDLTIWRDCPNLYKVNWYNLYKETYKVEWGKHPWIYVAYDEKWKDVILINTTDYRWTNNIDFQLLQTKYPGKLMYISSDINQYNIFTYKSKINIPFYKFNNFFDLCSAIKSCKLFIGSLSAPLTIAHAVHTDRIIGICNINEDNKLNSDLNFIWNNVKYVI